MKNQLTRLGYILTIVLVLWFIKNLHANADILSKIVWSWPVALSLVFSLLLYFISVLAIATAWNILLNSLRKVKGQFLISVSILTITQFGKYLPGNIAHHLGRVMLAKKYNLGTSIVIFSMMLENLWLIGASSLVSLFVLINVGDAYFKGLPEIPESAVFVFIILGVLIFPYAMRFIVKDILPKWTSLDALGNTKIDLPGFYVLWQCLFLYFLYYFLLGSIVLIVADGIFESTEGDLFLITGIFSVAWVVGFITPGAPAGLGIREVILVTALTPIYSSDIAVGITAMLRLVTVLGDGVVFLIGLGLARLALPDTAVTSDCDRG